MLRKRSCLCGVSIGWVRGDGKGWAYSRAWVLMRELMGLASVFLAAG
jgi:hypothetical protein